MRSQNLSDYSNQTAANITAKTTLFSDLDASFKRNIFTSDIYAKKDLDAVKASIMNIILTGKFEKPFQPRFGANIKAFLFENIDDNIADSMRDVIIDMINLYEPRATVLDVLFYASDNNDNAIRLTIQFSMKSTGTVAEVTTLLERIR